MDAPPKDGGMMGEGQKETKPASVYCPGNYLGPNVAVVVCR